MAEYRVTISTFIPTDGWFTVSAVAGTHSEARELFDSMRLKAPGPSLVSLEIDGRQLVFVSTFAPGVLYSRTEQVAC